MAYVLGFLFADGNIIKTKRNTWFWSLQITDKEILEEIKKQIGSTHTISVKNKIGNNKQIYRIQVGSKEMCADLIKLGLVQKKSNIMAFPKIPQKYFPDYLRGYFDGDGGVWVGVRNNKRKNSVIATCFTSGSLEFLKSLKNILYKKGVFGGSLVKKERGFDLKYSINDSLILYKIMYNNKTSLLLTRKKDKFEKYLRP